MKDTQIKASFWWNQTTGKNSLSEDSSKILIVFDAIIFNGMTHYICKDLQNQVVRVAADHITYIY